MHHKCLKRSQNSAKQDQAKTNGSYAERPIKDSLNNEPVITHQEREQLPIQPETATPGAALCCSTHV